MLFKTKFILFILFLTSYLVLVNSYYLENGFNNITRIKRQSSCSSLEFACDSGQCVSEDTECDGNEDCIDGSDETVACANIQCRSSLFRCAYGACINVDYECDGKKDCKDNSDETSPKCIKTSQRVNTNCNVDQFPCNSGECINSNLRCNGVKDCIDNSDEQGCGNGTRPLTSRIKPTTKPIKDGCALPPQLYDGKWSIFGPESSLNPGDFVKQGTVLIFQCNTQFKLYPAEITFSICNGSWSVIPRCIRTCSSIISTETMTATCEYNDSKVSCDRPYAGTRALLRCASALHEDPGILKRPYRYCLDGSWDHSLPNCEPVCGLKNVQAQTLVINGTSAKSGDYPWHIGLYYESNKNYFCGGSIITPKISLSAAHCFVLSNDPKKYVIAAGKYYSKYDEEKDENAQYTKISKLLIHRDYNGGRPFEAFDLAILVHETSFKMTRFVLPVCFDPNSNFDDSTLLDKTGTIIGWGYTEINSNQAVELKELEVEYRSKDTCTISQEFLEYYTYVPDKICAGLLQQGKSACRGDSGGGLVFKQTDGRYYIRGIVSVAPRRDNGCDSQQFTLFTNVAYHVDYIQKQRAVNGG